MIVKLTAELGGVVVTTHREVDDTLMDGDGRARYLDGIAEDWAAAAFRPAVSWEIVDVTVP